MRFEHYRLFRATVSTRRDGPEAATAASILAERCLAIQSAIVRTDAESGHVATAISTRCITCSCDRRSVLGCARAKAIRSAGLLPSFPTIPSRTRARPDAALDAFPTPQHIVDHVGTCHDSRDAAAQLTAPAAATAAAEPGTEYPSNGWTLRSTPTSPTSSLGRTAKRIPTGARAAGLGLAAESWQLREQHVNIVDVRWPSAGPGICRPTPISPRSAFDRSWPAVQPVLARIASNAAVNSIRVHRFPTTADA